MSKKIVIMNGKELSEKLLQKSILVNSENYRKPSLYVITVGDDKASQVYVKNKKKACEENNIEYMQLKYNEDISRVELVEIIQSLNEDNAVDGILVQQPVPHHLKGVEQYITSDKDVDGFTIENIGETLLNTNSINEELEHTLKLTACTPNGIMSLLESYDVPLQGKHIVIIGRSNIVGKPLIGLLLQKNCTVTSCNSYTENIKELTQTADVIISAIGKPKQIDSSYLSPKCVCVIDVGMNRDEDNKLCGDCDFTDILDYWTSLEKDSIFNRPTRYITPVPGGVGPMTVTSLIQNINKAYLNHIGDIDNGK